MKTKLLRILTAVAAGSGALAGLSATGIINIIPSHYSGILTAAALGAVAVKELAVVIGDFVDDGENNGSFKA